MNRLVIATRKSPLALAQASQVADCLRAAFGVDVELRKILTTGDRQAEWSLEKQGGKGLFTSELEQALLRGEVDLAVHSAKDLPGEMAEGLEIAGYLPREDARDVLVLRAGSPAPRSVATGSPRRRLQLEKLHPGVSFCEIRGNVDTRLRKIAELGAADGTVLAAAGLKRLGIKGWPGLDFNFLDLSSMVPAVGQAAIAVQCRAGEGRKWAGALDPATARTVSLERAFQRELGAGCHTAVAVHATNERLYFFHEQVGVHEAGLRPQDFDEPVAYARTWLSRIGVQSQSI
ncbi:MAG: hydroxymethylbilane synthase [Opitutaceae bacterium]|nr:hydroxymethylbilane synthase [Opitutaceae bacterium]